MIDRRTLIQGAAAAGFLTLPPVAMAEKATQIASGSDSLHLGWRTPSSDRLDTTMLEVEGAHPAGLRGVFRRNGPACHERHGFRYSHWFDGDGMIQEFQFGERGVSHRGRMVMTPKLRAEDAAGKRLFPAFATHVAGGPALRGPDDLNPANISVLDHHGELLALWEGGSASVINRDTLEWQEFKSWSDEARNMPFTAHPKVEADGTLWAFGYSLIPEPLLILYHVNASGQLINLSAFPISPLGMVHDFVITKRWIVIVIPPYVFDPDSNTNFLDAHTWRPELGSRVLIVSKDNFDDRRWLQLPAGFGFHHGNGWEEADGTIRFDHCVASDVSLLQTAFRDVMQGKMTSASQTRYKSFVLYPNGRVNITESGGLAEFPQVAPSIVGRRNRFVYMLGGHGSSTNWVPTTLEKRDIDNHTTERFNFGEAVILEEHIFVPFPESSTEDDGWLIGTFLDQERGVSGVNLFDARRISEGPIMRAWLPYPLPLGFHGQFSRA